jgi:hypothetical protein
VSQWRHARPEVITAAIIAVVAAIAGLALAGWPGLAVVATISAAVTLLVLRGLAPRPAPDATRKAAESDAATMRSLTGYSQRRFLVATGITSRSFYDSDLRPVLEHLLAARLAERHGINLYTDPAAAREAFARTARDEALWRWIDPTATGAQRHADRQRDPQRHRDLQRPRNLQGDRDRHGIPRQTLARLIDRLEHL